MGNVEPVLVKKVYGGMGLSNLVRKVIKVANDGYDKPVYEDPKGMYVLMATEYLALTDVEIDIITTFYTTPSEVDTLVDDNGKPIQLMIG